MVPSLGLEPRVLRLKVSCFSQLSYNGVIWRVVPSGRFERPTPGLAICGRKPPCFSYGDIRPSETLFVFYLAFCFVLWYNTSCY